MTTASFTHLATVAASTKREAAVNLTTGKAGAPATNINSLYCVRLHPAGSNENWRDILHMNDKIVDLLQTFVQDGLDIVSGDTLVVAGVEYPIRHVQRYPFGSTETRLLLILEDIKR